MRIKFPDETVIAGANQIGISRSVNGKRMLFGAADDMATGQRIEIPDDPHFIAKLCQELLRGHVGLAHQQEVNHAKGVYQIAVRAGQKTLTH